MTYGLLKYAIIPKEFYCPDLLWIVFTFQDSPDQRGWSAGSRFREPILFIFHPVSWLFRLLPGISEPPMNKFTCFLMRLAPQATVGSRTWSPNDKPYPLARSPFRIIPATGQVPYSMCTAEHCTQQSSPAGLPASTQCMPSALSASAGLHRHMWFYAALQELLPPVQTAPLPERVLIFPG